MPLTIHFLKSHLFEKATYLTLWSKGLCNMHVSYINCVPERKENLNNLTNVAGFCKAQKPH